MGFSKKIHGGNRESGRRFAPGRCSPRYREVERADNMPLANVFCWEGVRTVMKLSR